MNSFLKYLSPLKTLCATSEMDLLQNCECLCLKMKKKTHRHDTH